MQTLPLLTPGALFGFLFVLARIAGIFVFAPIPGMSNSPAVVRTVLTLAITVALFPLWPRMDGLEQNFARVTVCLFSEAALGLTIGLGVAFITEVLQMAAQIAALQAGYGYASTIDPSTQADSTVLMVFAQLFAGLLFFATGLDREVVRACAMSLHTFPPGKFLITAGIAESTIRLSTGIFSMGLRLAFPLITLLGLIDLSLALLGRLNAQLQLVTLAFPAKMLTALALLAFTAILFQRVFQSYAGQVMAVLQHFMNGV